MYVGLQESCPPPTGIVTLWLETGRTIFLASFRFGGMGRVGIWKLRCEIEQWHTDFSVSPVEAESCLRVPLPLRLLMSYICIYMEHLLLMCLDHTQRRSTVGRTPLDEWSARRGDLYLTTHDTQTDKYPSPRWDSNPRNYGRKLWQKYDFSIHPSHLKKKAVLIVETSALINPVSLCNNSEGPSS